MWFWGKRGRLAGIVLGYSVLVFVLWRHTYFDLVRRSISSPRSFLTLFNVLQAAVQNFIWSVLFPCNDVRSLMLNQPQHANWAKLHSIQVFQCSFVCVLVVLGETTAYSALYGKLFVLYSPHSPADCSCCGNHSISNVVRNGLICARITDFAF